MIPLCIPNLCGNEGRYLAECIETTFVSTVGPFVSRLEGMVAQASGATACVATSAGTTGLHLALLAVGVGPGDLVVLPSFTFIASANAISHCGATPWLFDVAADSWTLDAALLARHLAAETERTLRGLVHKASGRRVAAIMPVYTLGQPADMDEIRSIARDYHLPVVADAAAAIGASYRGRPVGGLADLSVHSFNGNKTITSGGGGAVLSDDAELVAAARHLSGTARVGADYSHDRVGFNYRMTNIQAAVGCAQMENLDQFIAAKRRIRADYESGLAGLPGIDFFPNPAWAGSACWFSGIVLAKGARLETAELRARLVEAGIEARPFWKPMHLQAPYAEAPRTAQDVADSVWQRVVTLPCSTQLNAVDQARVIASVRELLA